MIEIQIEMLWKTNIDWYSSLHWYSTSSAVFTQYSININRLPVHSDIFWEDI